MIFVKLKPTEPIKPGDRPIYADGEIGSETIPAHEHGIKAGESGYWAVARPVKTTKRT